MYAEQSERASGCRSEAVLFPAVHLFLSTVRPFTPWVGGSVLREAQAPVVEGGMGLVGRTLDQAQGVNFAVG